MKATITGMAPHQDGLRLGLTIEHEKAGWIRFTTTILLVSALTQEERALLHKALNRAVDDYLDAEVDPVLF